MDLSSIEQIIRTQVPNAQDSEVELYLDSVKRDMKFGADYSDMSEDDIVEDFEFFFQSKMDEVKKPSMKMTRRELKEMIKTAFLSEADFTNAQDDDAALGGMYDPVYEGVDLAIAKLADKVEDLPIVDKLADKIQANPKAMDALNKLAAMYGGSVNENISGLDLATIIKKSQEFADKVNEGDGSGNAAFTTSGILGGPLLFTLLGLIPGAMETVMQTVNTAAGIDPSYYEPAYLLSVVGGVLVGALIDKIKNNLEEAEDEEETAEREETAEEILARITGTKLDPYSLAEAKDEEEETDVTVDAEEETTDGGEEKLANDSIVVDKKIVSLSSLPQQTRKILDSLETLRAQAEEFGDQKFITQVGNTITFFTRDFVVAGDEPTKAKVDESLEILKMKKLAGLLTEGEYAKALLKEIGMEASFLPVDPVPGTAELTSNLFNSLKNKLMASGEKIINKVPKDELMAMKSAAEKVLGPGFGKEDITMDNAEKVGKVLMSRLNEGNIADTIGSILALVGMGAGTFGFSSGDAPVAIAGLVAMILGYIIGRTFGDDNDISIDRGI